MAFILLFLLHMLTQIYRKEIVTQHFGSTGGAGAAYFQKTLSLSEILIVKRVAMEVKVFQYVEKNISL